MITSDKRVRIITGHYGSGKTEFAVNYATKLAKLPNQKVAIADMDIVNVYFRSREVRQQLMTQGIRVIDSNINTSVEVPAIPAESFAPFEDKSYSYIIDLGGNAVGTIVLGRYAKYVKADDVDFFMVVNVFRPDTSSVEKIIAEKEKLEIACGIKVTGFVNNSNLVRQTTVEDVLFGEKMIFEVSQITKIPLKYTTYIKEVLEIEEKNKGDFLAEVFPMSYFMRPTWM